MHTRGFAAAWEKFKFPPHMDEVEPGDVIFMFAKSVGIIGVGVAEGTCERLSPKQAGRIATLHPTVEWRIPVRWLVWTDINGAFRWKSNNFTFWNVSDPPYREFREQVMEHFLESE